MTALYKLLFDLAVYYAVSGYYLRVFWDRQPSFLGFFLLVLSVGAALLLEKRLIPPLRAAIPMLALLCLFTRPGIAALLQLLPAVAYLSFSLYTGATKLRFEEFRDHFFFGLRLLLVVLPPLLFSRRAVPALMEMIPYLVFLLAAGVCLMRMLREKTASGGKQALFIGAFLLGCALFTAGRAPQLLWSALTFFYQKIFAPVILMAIIAVGMFVYLFFKGFFWLVSLLRKEEAEPVQLDLRSAAETMGLEDTYDYVVKDFPLMRIIGYVLLAVGILLALIWLFRRLLGERKGETAEEAASERSGAAPPMEKKRKPGLTRPRDPRLAVRYYYARFLRECRRRKVVLSPGMTSRELAAACAYAFPGADPAILQRLYLPARYSSHTPVTGADANAARDAWRELKKTRLKEE